MRSSVVLVLFLAACGGKIAQGPDAADETKPDPATAAPSSGDSTGAPAGIGAAADEVTPLPATTLSAAGACAAWKSSDSKILSVDAPRCQVKNQNTYPDGRVEIELVNGDAGAAQLVDGSLLLTCGTKGKLLFQAVLRCYAFDGTYTIAPGDLILGTEVSDRKCHLDVDDDGTDVSGFVACDDEGASALFSSNDAPVSLGAFTLPKTR